MARRWIIDGNNVFGSRPDGWWRDRAAAAVRLASSVDRWQRRVGEPTVVVFDGPEPPELDGCSRPGFRVVVAPAPGRDAADHRIVAEVEDRYATEPDLVVVTADRGLIDRLPPGVGVERPRRFLERLEEPG